MKTTATQFILLIIVVTLASCANDPKQLKDGDTIFYPDTVAFKESWKMEEKVMREDLFVADTFYNALGLDTFELSYWPCDCPDWIDLAKVHLDCKECSDFYIEPADLSLKFPDEFIVHDNTVRFYGVRIPEMGLPKYKEFPSQGQRPMWTIIKYYGYEVVRPYKVWTPRPVFYDELNDTIDVPLVVTFQ